MKCCASHSSNESHASEEEEEGGWGVGLAGDDGCGYTCHMPRTGRGESNHKKSARIYT